MTKNVRQLVGNGEHIFIGGLSSVGHRLCHLVGVPVDGQWLSIPHPGESGGRGTGGCTG